MSATQTTPENGVSLTPAARRAALVEAAATREMAEVQAAMVIAQRFPRDERAAIDRIVNACTRPSLAERATYEYARGGQPISGPSIRLAEVIAQQWGNIDCGVRELEQRPGESIVEAFAWDLETNMRDRKVFTVPHVRDTKKGRVILEDARDIYETVANNGARRKRACILAVIPGDVVERAVLQCQKTLETKYQVTPESIKEILDMFSAVGVTKPQIEKFLQRKIEAAPPALMVRLRGIYNVIRDGLSTPADWFEAEDAKPADGAKTRTEELREDLAGGAKAKTPPAQEQDPEPPSQADVAKARELRGQLSKLWKNVDTAIYRDVMEREYGKRGLTDLTVEQLQDFLERTPELLPEGAQQ